MKEPTLQYDENVKLPKGVLAAAARAEELYNALRDEPVAPAGDDQVTSEGNPELNAASLLNNEPPAAQNDNAPQQQQQQQQQPVQPQEPAQSEGDESWEHKYKSVHGRYMRSQEQVRQLSEQVQGLQNVIATMQATAAAPAAPTTLPELNAEGLITPEEVNDYGEDFLKVVGKKAQEVFAPIYAAQKAEIERLTKQLEGFSGFVQQDSHQKLLSTLDRDLPSWRELNTNEDFLNWLRLPDPYSGAIRHDMLKAAYAQGNAHRVLAFFNGFLAEEAAVAPAQREPDISVTTVPKVPLQNLAAPGRAKTAAAPAPAEKPIFTRAQIAAFYADVASGKYRGRDAEKLKNETLIFEAQREGRIR